MAFNFIHINIMSGSDSSLVEKNQIGRATPENTMLKTTRVSALKGDARKMSKSEVLGGKKPAAKTLLLRKINHDFKKKFKKKTGRDKLPKKNLNGWGFKGKKFARKKDSNQSSKKALDRRERDPKLSSKSQVKKARVKPTGEYGVQPSRSLRPDSASQRSGRVKKTRSRNNSDKSGDTGVFKANRNSDPGNKVARKKFQAGKKLRGRNESAEQGKCVSLNDDKKPLKRSIYSRIKGTVKRPIKRTPILKSKKGKFGKLGRVMELFGKGKRSPGPRTERSRTKKKSKSKSKSIKKTDLLGAAKKWAGVRGHFRQKLRKGDEQKREIKSVKVAERESRFGSKKLRQASKYISIGKLRQAGGFEKEDPYSKNDRSKSSNAQLRTEPGKYRLELEGGKSKAARSINNISKHQQKLQKKINASQSVDKEGKKHKFKTLWQNRPKRPIKFKKHELISSSKKLKNLTGRPYVPKFNSNRGLGTDNEPQRTRPAAFNEYDQRDNATTQEAAKKGLSTRSFRKVFSKKYSDQLKKLGVGNAVRAVKKSPFKRVLAKRPQNQLHSPRAKKFLSNKEIMQLPYSHLKKSAKKKLKKKSSKNLAEQRRLFGKKSSKRLSIDKKAPTRTQKSQGVKASSGANHLARDKVLSRSPLNGGRLLHMRRLNNQFLNLGKPFGSKQLKKRIQDKNMIKEQLRLELERMYNKDKKTN